MSYSLHTTCMLRACLDPKSLHPKTFGCKLYFQVGVYMLPKFFGLQDT